MSFTQPGLILITSDNNQLQFIKTIKTKNELLYQYKFIKSITKLNCVVEFTEGELCRQINNFFQPIN